MEKVVERIIEKEVPVEPREIQYQPVYMPMPVQMVPVQYYQVGTQEQEVVETTEVERQDEEPIVETTEIIVPAETLVRE